MSKSERNKIIHSIIGVVIMLGVGFLPIEITGITQIGLRIIGIFIGTLYLWSTVEGMWPSLLAVACIGFSSYGTMGSILAAFLGSGTAIQLLFMMLFSGGLIYYGITKYIVRFSLTLKFVQGKPWATTALLLGTCYFIAAFVGPFVSIFIFFSIMYNVYEQVGFKKEDTYVKITLVLVTILSMFGAGTMPYRAGIVSITSSYANLTGGESTINSGMYFLFTFSLGIILFIALLLVSKYIIRPDMTPLKTLDIEELNKDKLPPMSLQQKIISISFVILLIMMLVPSIFTGIPIMVYLSNCSTAYAMVVVAILCAIRIDGKPVFDFQAVARKQFSWETYMLSMVAILFGSVLTNDSVGLTTFLDSVLTPIFEQISPNAFIIAVIIVTAILTNIGNSLVMGLLLLPIIYTYSVNFGVEAVPIVMLLAFTVNATAAMTPAASAYSAILFGNGEWIKAKDIYKYSGIYVLTLLVVIIIIGIPLVNLFV
ncbi:MAG: citrate transporter [Eubacteriales bacterium]